MAGRCSFLPLARLLLLVVVLGGVLQGCGAVASRPLLGIAEPPASPGAVAAGPSAAAESGVGDGRPDRSEAGGEVIVAGFAAALIIVIFCYIRVTRQTTTTSSSNGGSVGEGEKQGSLGGF